MAWKDLASNECPTKTEIEESIYQWGFNVAIKNFSDNATEFLEIKPYGLIIIEHLNTNSLHSVYLINSYYNGDIFHIAGRSFYNYVGNLGEKQRMPFDCTWTGNDSFENKVRIYPHYYGFGSGTIYGDGQWINTTLKVYYQNLYQK